MGGGGHKAQNAGGRGPSTVLKKRMTNPRSGGTGEREKTTLDLVATPPPEPGLPGTTGEGERTNLDLVTPPSPASVPGEGGRGGVPGEGGRGGVPGEGGPPREIERGVVAPPSAATPRPVLGPPTVSFASDAHRERANANARAMFGREFAPEDYAHIVGAPDGSSVLVRGTANGFVATTTHPEGWTSTTREFAVYPGADGAPEMLMNDVRPYYEGGTPPGGMPGSDHMVLPDAQETAQSFAATVRGAQQYGVGFIALKSNGNADARLFSSLGFDAAIQETRESERLDSPALAGDAARPFPARFGGARTVREMTSMPGGQAYWERVAATGGMEFDLRPGSADLAILNARLESMGLPGVEVGAPPRALTRADIRGLVQTLHDRERSGADVRELRRRAREMTPEDYAVARRLYADYARERFVGRVPTIGPRPADRAAGRRVDPEALADVAFQNARRAIPVPGREGHGALVPLARESIEATLAALPPEQQAAYFRRLFDLTTGRVAPGALTWKEPLPGHLPLGGAGPEPGFERALFPVDVFPDGTKAAHDMTLDELRAFVDANPGMLSEEDLRPLTPAPPRPARPPRRSATEPVRPAEPLPPIEPTIVPRAMPTIQPAPRRGHVRARVARERARIIRARTPGMAPEARPEDFPRGIADMTPVAPVTPDEMRFTPGDVRSPLRLDALARAYGEERLGAILARQPMAALRATAEQHGVSDLIRGVKSREDVASILTAWATRDRYAADFERPVAIPRQAEIRPEALARPGDALREMARAYGPELARALREQKMATLRDMVRAWRAEHPEAGVPGRSKADVADYLAREVAAEGGARPAARDDLGALVRAYGTADIRAVLGAQDVAHLRAMARAEAVRRGGVAPSARAAKADLVAYLADAALGRGVPSGRFERGVVARPADHLRALVGDGAEAAREALSRQSMASLREMARAVHAEHPEQPPFQTARATKADLVAHLVEAAGWGPPPRVAPTTPVVRPGATAEEVRRALDEFNREHGLGRYAAEPAPVQPFPYDGPRYPEMPASESERVDLESIRGQIQDPLAETIARGEEKIAAAAAPLTEEEKAIAAQPALVNPVDVAARLLRGNPTTPEERAVLGREINNLDPYLRGPTRDALLAADPTTQVADVVVEVPRPPFAHTPGEGPAPEVPVAPESIVPEPSTLHLSDEARSALAEFQRQQQAALAGYVEQHGLDRTPDTAPLEAAIEQADVAQGPDAVERFVAAVEGRPPEDGGTPPTEGGAPVAPAGPPPGPAPQTGDGIVVPEGTAMDIIRGVGEGGASPQTSPDVRAAQAHMDAAQEIIRAAGEDPFSYYKGDDPTVRQAFADHMQARATLRQAQLRADLAAHAGEERGWPEGTRLPFTLDQFESATLYPLEVGQNGTSESYRARIEGRDYFIKRASSISSAGVTNISAEVESRNAAMAAEILRATGLDSVGMAPEQIDVNGERWMVTPWLDGYHNLSGTESRMDAFAKNGRVTQIARRLSPTQVRDAALVGHLIAMTDDHLGNYVVNDATRDLRVVDFERAFGTTRQSGAAPDSVARWLWRAQIGGDAREQDSRRDARMRLDRGQLRRIAAAGPAIIQSMRERGFDEYQIRSMQDRLDVVAAAAELKNPTMRDITRIAEDVGVRSGEREERLAAIEKANRVIGRESGDELPPEGGAPVAPAGPPPGPAPTQPEVRWPAGDEQASRDAIAQMFGRPLTDEEVAGLVGARPGDVVEVASATYDPRAGGRISFELRGDGYAAYRFLDASSAEYGAPRLTMENEFFRVNEAGRGVGLDVFSRQVATAQALGVESIRTEARGVPSGAYQGYYAWARMGYNTSLEDALGEDYATAPDWVRAAGDMHGLMATPATADHESGADWWRQNGQTWHGTFITTPGSSSIQALNAYRAEKGLPPIGGPASARDLAALEGEVAARQEAAGRATEALRAWAPGEPGRAPLYRASLDADLALRRAQMDLARARGETPAVQAGAPFTGEQFLSAELRARDTLDGGSREGYFARIGDGEYYVKVAGDARDPWADARRISSEVAAPRVLEAAGLGDVATPAWRVDALGRTWVVSRLNAGERPIDEIDRGGLAGAMSDRTLGRVALGAYLLNDYDRTASNITVDPGAGTAHHIDAGSAFSAGPFRPGGELALWEDRVLGQPVPVVDDPRARMAFDREDLARVAQGRDAALAAARAAGLDETATDALARRFDVVDALARLDSPTYADLVRLDGEGGVARETGGTPPQAPPEGGTPLAPEGAPSAPPAGEFNPASRESFARFMDANRDAIVARAVANFEAMTPEARAEESGLRTPTTTVLHDGTPIFVKENDDRRLGASSVAHEQGDREVGAQALAEALGWGDLLPPQQIVRDQAGEHTYIAQPWAPQGGEMTAERFSEAYARLSPEERARFAFYDFLTGDLDRGGYGDEGDHTKNFALDAEGRLKFSDLGLAFARGDWGGMAAYRYAYGDPARGVAPVEFTREQVDGLLRRAGDTLKAVADADWRHPDVRERALRYLGRQYALLGRFAEGDDLSFARLLALDHDMTHAEAYAMPGYPLPPWGGFVQRTAMNDEADARQADFASAWAAHQEAPTAETKAALDAQVEALREQVAQARAANGAVTPLVEGETPPAEPPTGLAHPRFERMARESQDEVARRAQERAQAREGELRVLASSGRLPAAWPEPDVAPPFSPAEFAQARLEPLGVAQGEHANEAYRAEIAGEPYLVKYGEDLAGLWGGGQRDVLDQLRNEAASPALLEAAGLGDVAVPAYVASVGDRHWVVSPWQEGARPVGFSTARQIEAARAVPEDVARRLAIAEYLVNDFDRSAGNVIYDPATGRAWHIDMIHGLRGANFAPERWAGRDLWAARFPGATDADAWAQMRFDPAELRAIADRRDEAARALAAHGGNPERTGLLSRFDVLRRLSETPDATYADLRRLDGRFYDPEAPQALSRPESTAPRPSAGDVASAAIHDVASRLPASTTDAAAARAEQAKWEAAVEATRAHLDATSASFRPETGYGPINAARDLHDEATFQAARARAIADRIERGPAEPAPTYDRSPLDRARTSDDVEGWLKANFPDLRGGLLGARTERAVAMARELADFAERYPEVARTLGFYVSHGDPTVHDLVRDVTELSEGDWEKTFGLYQRAHDDKPAGIFLTHQALDHFAQREWISREIVPDEHGMRFPTADDPSVDVAAYTARHELGHHVAATIAGMGPEGKAAIERLYKGAPARAYDARNLSTYAMESGGERFAEAFAAAKYGSERAKNDPYTREVMDTIDAFLGPGHAPATPGGGGPADGGPGVERLAREPDQARAGLLAALRADQERLDAEARRLGTEVMRAQREHNRTVRDISRQREDAAAQGRPADEASFEARARASYAAYERALAEADTARYRADFAKVAADRIERGMPDPYTVDTTRLDAIGTTEDLGAWTRGAFPHVASGFRGSNVDLARGAARELAAFAAEYPEVARTMGVYGYVRDPNISAVTQRDYDDVTMPMQGRWGTAQASAKHGTVGVFFGTKSVDPRYEPVWHDEIRSNWAAVDPLGPPVSVAEYTARHELGHVIFGYMRAHSPEGARMVDYLYDGAGAKLGDPENISRYAASAGGGERAAEAFAALKYGDERAKNDPYVREVAAVLEAFFGKPGAPGEEPMAGGGQKSSAGGLTAATETMKGWQAEGQARAAERGTTGLDLAAGGEAAPAAARPEPVGGAEAVGGAGGEAGRGGARPEQPPVARPEMVRGEGRPAQRPGVENRLLLPHGGRPTPSVDAQAARQNLELARQAGLDIAREDTVDFQEPPAGRPAEAPDVGGRSFGDFYDANRQAIAERAADAFAAMPATTRADAGQRTPTSRVNVGGRDLFVKENYDRPFGAPGSVAHLQGDNEVAAQSVLDAAGLSGALVDQRVVRGADGEHTYVVQPWSEQPPGRAMDMRTFDERLAALSPAQRADLALADFLTGDADRGGVAGGARNFALDPSGALHMSDMGRAFGRDGWYGLPALRYAQGVPDPAAGPFREGAPLVAAPVTFSREQVDDVLARGGAMLQALDRAQWRNPEARERAKEYLHGQLATLRRFAAGDDLSFQRLLDLHNAARSVGDARPQALKTRDPQEVADAKLARTTEEISASRGVARAAIAPFEARLPVDAADAAVARATADRLTREREVARARYQAAIGAYERASEGGDTAAAEAANRTVAQLGYTLDEAIYQAARANAIANRLTAPARTAASVDRTGLNAARNVGDVMRWFQASFPEVRAQFAEGHYERVRAAAHEFASLADEFPRVADALASYVYSADPQVQALIRAVPNMTPEKWAHTMGLFQESLPEHPGPFVVLTPLALGADAQAAFSGEGIRTGAFATRDPRVDIAAYTARHEFGHFIAAYIARSSPEGERAIQRLINGAPAQAYSAFSLSTYAAESGLERIAEAWAAVEYGTPAMRNDPYVREVVDTFRAFLGPRTTGKP